MVFDLDFTLLSSLVEQIVLAHGADPTPLDWDEALANIVKFFVTFVLIGFLSYPVLAPLFSGPEEAPSKATSNADRPKLNNTEAVGWVGAGLLLILAVGWWLTRTSLVEVMTEESTVKEDHAHTQTEGGQIAMWADFHAEVVRVESGELRVYLRDSYNREIAARFFEAEVQPLESAPQPTDDVTPTPRATASPRVSGDSASKEGFLSTESALNQAYRFCRLGREVNRYRVKISTPGWTTTLKFDFNGSRGKRSLPIWCAPP